MAFAPNCDLQIDPVTGLLVAVSIGHLARAVCAAAEIEILRGGESQGTQYANSSMTTTQVSRQQPTSPPPNARTSSPMLAS